MTKNELITWLLEGDVSIQFQACRDLLGIEKPGLRQKIAEEGWGAKFLSCRQPDGHWGRAFYQPKWTSSHYTLLDLKNLNISSDNKQIDESLNNIFKNEKAPDGGIKPIGSHRKSDVCINGMVLNYASYFRVKEEHLKSVVDCLLYKQMTDGGFNCQSDKKGTKHSSLHTTISVIEGILEYRKNNYKYRLKELAEAEKKSQEFILRHHLFRSDKTGAIINQDFLKLQYPDRWHYNILRALDYFQFAGVEYDNRMDDALNMLVKKRNAALQWILPAKIPGELHFEMEKSGKPSRWITLKALRILKYFKAED